MNPTIIALTIGCLAGAVAALCGVGGGVFMVPAFVLILKMGQKTAVATSLAAIVLTAIFTSLKNHSNGLIAWKIAIAAGVGGAIVGWSAADLLKKLHDVTLTRIFAVLMIVFGIQMWWQSYRKENLSNGSESVKRDEH
jgi:uncharacterized membrane protein YfcA